MPVSVSHALSATTPDNPSYEIRPSHWNSAHNVTLSATAGTEIYGAFSNDPAYNVSFTTNAGGQVVASANVTAAPSPVNVTGANGSSVNAQTIAFSNANGLSLGVSTAANGATVTGSYTVPTQSVQTQASGNIGATGFVTTTSAGLVIAGTNNTTGFTLGVPPFITTYVAQTTQTQAGGSIAGIGYTSTTQAGSTVGMTHGTNGLSAAWPPFITTYAAGGNATAYAQSNTTQSSSGTFPVSSMQFAGAGIVSVGVSGGSVVVSGPGSSVLSQLSAGISGGNTSGNTGTVAQGQIVFAGGNNITLSGSTNGSSMTVTISGGTAGGGGVAIAASNSTFTSGTVVMSAAGGALTISNGAQSALFSVPQTSSLVAGANITISTNGSTISIIGGTAAADGVNILSLGTSTYGGGTGGATYSASSGTVGFYAGSNITLSQTSNSIIWYGASGGAANLSVSDNATSLTVSRLAFTNLNNITLSLSTGAGAATVVGSFSTSQSVQTQASGNIVGSGYTSTSTAGTGLVGTLNSSGISLGVPAWITTYAAQSVQTQASGSIAGSGFTTTATAGTAVVGTHDTGGLKLGVPPFITTYAAQTNQTLSWAATGGTVGNTSGMSVNATGLTVAGSGAVSVGYSTSAGGSSILISAPNTIAQSVQTQASGSIAGSGFTTTATAGTAVVGTHDTGGLKLGVPAFITTYVAQTVQPVAVSNSAGSFLFSTLNFSNANNVTFGTSAGNIVTASVQNPTGITALAVSANGGGTSNAVTGLTFANSQGVTFGMLTAASLGTITASVAAQSNQTLSLAATGNTTGGTSGMSNNATGLTLSGAGALSLGFSTSAGGSTAIFSAPATSQLTGVNGISVSSNGSTISIQPVYFSSFQNYADMDNMATGASGLTATSGSSIYVQPFVLPYAVSASYLRLFASLNDSAVGTAGTTSANTNFSCRRYTTIAMVLYTNGAGASSRSIQSYTSTSVGITGATIFSAGANGSQYTMTLQKSYPVTGSTSSYTTSYAVSSGSIVVSSNSNTLFTGNQYIDIPFAVSLSGGEYWLGIGASTSSASQTSHISFCGTGGMPMTLNCLTQQPYSGALFGAASAASDNQVMLGLGLWTTNASNISTGSIGLNSISQVVSNPQIPFNLIRQA